MERHFGLSRRLCFEMIDPLEMKQRLETLNAYNLVVNWPTSGRHIGR
jgi:hypothetical protein